MNSVDKGKFWGDIMNKKLAVLSLANVKKLGFLSYWSCRFSGFTASG